MESNPLTAASQRPAGTRHYLEHLATATVEEFRADPLPGWAGLATLFGCPATDSFAAKNHCFVAVGIPFDSTASSRPGAAEGPQAIRAASRVYRSYITSLGEHDMIDMRTGQSFRYHRPLLADVGDVHVYPTDGIRTFQAIAREVEAIAHGGARIVILGGDHSISFPAFVGVSTARGCSGKIGYLQIDHHFDFGDRSAIHGGFYHGSNARRISELPWMDCNRVGFVGVGCVTRKGQFEALSSDGYQVITAAELRQGNASARLDELARHFEALCDSVYLSVDIDVLNASEAPGTGNVTIGGLDAALLMDVLLAFKHLPLCAVDVVEVAPRYDVTGRTAQLASQLLFEMLYRDR